MWTKHGFPTERVEKLMENDRAVYHELFHTNPPFDHIPPYITQRQPENACGATIIIFLKFGKRYTSTLPCRLELYYGATSLCLSKDEPRLSNAFKYFDSSYGV